MFTYIIEWRCSMIVKITPVALLCTLALCYAGCAGSGSDKPENSNPNIALNKKALASSFEKANQYSGNIDLAPALAVDGDTNTRWGSDWSRDKDPGAAWIYVDLGERMPFLEVQIKWEPSKAADYNIETSDDALAWTVVKAVTGNVSTDNDTILDKPVTARYVKINCKKRSTQYGYSIFEIGIYRAVVKNSGGGNLPSGPGKISQGPVRYKNGKFLGNTFDISSTPLKFSIYWNQVTPENKGKWGEVEPVRNSYIWDYLDGIYNYAKSNGILFKMHNLIWGQQQPAWITSLSSAGQRLAIIAWISNVGARYADMDFIDVVNEPINTPPSYMDSIGGSGSTGWDWVVFAYMQARKYCKGKLLINEYNVENNTFECAQYTNIVMILKSSNLIDGIGIQCHNFSLGSASTSTLSNCLGMMAATGLPIYVSEMDLNGATDAFQLSLYKKYFPILWDYGDIKGVTLWGYIEGRKWFQNDWLLSSVGSERPALAWITNYAMTGQ